MPLGLAVASQQVAACAPPSWFRGVEGVRRAWSLSDGSPGRTPKQRIKGSAAQRAGIRYERKALEFLTRNVPGFRQQPWFKFVAENGNLRWCQPDGILPLDRYGVVVFEVKVTFTSDAWWQLRKLYEPVLKRALGVDRVVPCLVCKNFDPAVPFPERYVHLTNLNVLSSPAGEWDCTQTGVFVWRPRS